MSCASKYVCIMAMISNFSIIFIFFKLFMIFFCKCNILLHFDVILVLFLLTIAFFFSFQSQSYCSRVLLKIHKTFSDNLLRDINYGCFLYDQMPKLLNILTIFVTEDFSELFAHPSIFSIKDSRLA